jgi:hypothetical protein
MSDSNIVVSCHCKLHKQLYHVKEDGKKGPALGSGATYIDPYTCPETQWSSVKEASVDFVWGENCSVYIQLTHGLQLTKAGKTVQLKNSQNKNVGSNQVLFRILNECYRVLKVGGKAIFGDFGPITETVKTNLALIKANPEISAHYSVEVVPALGYEIHLAQMYVRKFLPKSYLYVFTKKSVVGGNRTRRYRQQRSKTAKQKLNKI